ncbi:c-type cytochrome [Parahaliea aestuarii]|uniref:c-type cytochrome n=1 Tax=Parahaliea aestuarii TaxID=1852021 RepID=UPI00164F02F7|nr:adenylate cyclase [Parahaliea aestuarii]
MKYYQGCLALLCLLSVGCLAQPEEQAGPAVTSAGTALTGDVERGRLVFGPCRTCHYPDPALGHNNGPNLYRIFGKVAGKQPGFDYYSETFKNAEFVWTPQLLDLWLADPRAMFPGSTMMSLGVPDPQRRADLIAYLKQASVRGSDADGNSENKEDARD